MFTFEYGCGDANANISKWPVLMTTRSVYVTFFWHQANHMKIVVFLLNREKDIISSRSYTKYYPARTRFILAGCQKKKYCKKPIFKMGDTNLKKNGSLLLYLNTWGLDTLILCLVGVLHLLDTQRYLFHSAGKMRSYFPAWPTSRSAVVEISVRRGNF